jgi:hypothetical protein
MTEILSPAGYEQTKVKLSDLERRMARLDQLTKANPQHQIEARQSYERMMSQYRREIKLYEASHSESTAK